MTDQCEFVGSKAEWPYVKRCVNSAMPHSNYCFACASLAENEVSMYKRYLVEAVWRYKEGHRETAVMSRTVKCVSDESAEKWGTEMVCRKFGQDNVEVIKVNYQILD